MATASELLMALMVKGVDSDALGLGTRYIPDSNVGPTEKRKLHRSDWPACDDIIKIS